MKISNIFSNFGKFFLFNYIQLQIMEVSVAFMHKSKCLKIRYLFTLHNKILNFSVKATIPSLMSQ